MTIPSLDHKREIPTFLKDTRIRHELITVKRKTVVQMADMLKEIRRFYRLFNRTGSTSVETKIFAVFFSRKLSRQPVHVY
jgi:hypothetical protein